MLVNQGNEPYNTSMSLGGYMRISKYKNIFAKIYIPNWSEKVLVVRNTVLWTYVFNNLNGQDIALTFQKEITKDKSKKNL